MVWNKIYRTKFLNDNQIRFWEDISYGEDEIFNLECLLKARIIRCFSPNIIIRHFDNKESIVHLLMKEDVDKQRNALKKLKAKVSGSDKEIIEDIIQEHNKSEWTKRILAKKDKHD